MNKVLTKNFIEFTIDIGFDKFNLLKKHFGQNDESGELKGCDYDYKTGIAKFSTKLLPFVFDCFKDGEIDTSCLNEIAEYMSGTGYFDVSNQDFLYNEQFELIKKLRKRRYGLAQCVTGFGKNVLITYIVKHYTGKGNILLIAPTKAILEEIELRAKAFNVEFDPKKIRYIHAAGFMNSNNKDNILWKSWMSKVETIIIDEAENIAESTKEIIRNYCYNHKSIYGFSATSDRFNNQKLSYGNIKYSELHDETARLMYYIGTTSIYKAPEKVINVLQAWLPLPQEQKLPPWMQMQAVPKAVDNVLKSNAVLRYIDFIESKYSDKILFIPVKTIEQGKLLLNYCSKKDYKSVFWSGSGIESTDNIEKLKISSYEILKKNANKHKLQIIIATQVGFKGIDIKAITDILLIIGTNASVVNQIIGRAYRTEEDIRLWLLYNENDRYVDWKKNPNEVSTPIYNACNGARARQIHMSQKYTWNEIDISNNSMKLKTESTGDIEKRSKKEQLMNSSMREQAKILESLMKHKGK